MSMIDETKRTYERFGVYVDELRIVCTERGITGEKKSHYLKVLRLFVADQEFRGKVLRVLKDAASSEGGKLSFGTAGVIVGLAIGGVGIAGMGSAIGIPAFFVTMFAALLGGIFGQEIDAQRLEPKTSAVSGHGSFEVSEEEMPLTSDLKNRLDRLERSFDQFHHDLAVHQSNMLSTSELMKNSLASQRESTEALLDAIRAQLVKEERLSLVNTALTSLILLLAIAAVLRISSH